MSQTSISKSSGQLEVNPSGRVRAWVTHESTNPSLGIIRAPFYFVRAHVHVTEAFDSGGNLEIGYDSDNDAFVTAVSVGSTGVKSATLGTLSGYNGTSNKVNAYLSASGHTTGKALVILEFFRIPNEPT